MTTKPYRVYRRVPVEDLLQYLRATTDRRSIRAMASRVGTSDRQFHRWLDYGIRLREAENIADHLGVHILEIWPGAYERMAA